MPYTDTPSDLFAGMSVSTGNLVIPISVLAPHGLTEELADPTIGDARTLAYSLISRIDEWYRELAVADRPQAVTSSASISVVSYNDDEFAGCEREVIKVTAYRIRPEGSIADEPA